MSGGRRAGAEVFRMSAVLLSAVILTGCFSLRHKASPARESLPADVAAHVSRDRPFDHRPYEMIWSERRQFVDPLVDFERLMGWTVEYTGPGRVGFSASQEKQLWGDYTGKLAFSGLATPAEVIVRPPEPLPIQDAFNCIDLWVFRPAQAGGAPPIVPPEIALLIEDSDGNTHRLDVTTVNWLGWFLAHRRLDRSAAQTMRFPCRLTGIAFRLPKIRGSSTLYLDSLALYTETLNPLRFLPQPAAPLDLFPIPSERNAPIEGTLDFPNRRETMCPPILTQGYTNRVTKRRDGTYSLLYKGPDGTLEYRLDPRFCPGGLEAWWKGKRLARPLDGSGCSPLKRAPRMLMDRTESAAVRVQYEKGLSYRYAINGKSLRVDISGPTMGVNTLDAGAVFASNGLRRVAIPFLNYGRNQSAYVAALSNAPPDRFLYLGVWFDWTRSNASTYYGPEQGPSAGKPGRIQGGAHYFPRTDGRRNALRERIIISLSPQIEEVLPSIPNPPAEHRDFKRLWISAETAREYKVEAQRLHALAALGLRHILYCPGPWTWRDAWESDSLRTRAAPGRGGDAALRSFLSTVRALGWRPGLTCNLRDLSPLSPFWNPDDVQRLRNGDWRRSSLTDYALKPERALERQAALLIERKKKFGPAASMMTAQVSSAPWDNTDYDERVPAAGRFAKTYYRYGELLRRQEVLSPPVVGEGPFAWLYAGLADAFLAQAGAGGARAGDPWLPLFALTRLHPLAVSYGLGSMKNFFGREPRDAADTERMLDRYLAAQIAYGHAGRLPADTLASPLLARAYYLMQALQSRYLERAPKTIAYWDGERYCSTSKAIPRDLIRDPQLYLYYPGDLEIWINGANNRNWKVQTSAGTWMLPPFGWVATGKDFFECSALVDGRRRDYVEAKEYRYADGRGAASVFRGIAAAGPLAIRTVGSAMDRRIEVLAISGAAPFMVSGIWKEGRPESCRALNAEGKDLGPAPFEWEKNAVRVQGVPGAVRYLFRPGRDE